MSTAAAFLFPRSFPFCLANISAAVPSNAAYLDNLTLAQVMAFAWNLETLSISTAGEVTFSSPPDPDIVCNGDMSFALNPIACDRVDQGELSNVSMWFGDVTGTEVSFASWPDFRVPRERICYPYEATNHGCLIESFGNDTTDRNDFMVCFYVGTDPGNAGKYRIYYILDFGFTDTVTETIEIRFSVDGYTVGMTAWNTGTITIGGLSFTWYSSYTTGSVPSGTGAMTASSTSFTY